MKTNVSEHSYKDGIDDGDTFEVYQLNDKWYWSFCCVWRDPGPFNSEEEAIAAGEKCLDEKGEYYFRTA